MNKITVIKRAIPKPHTERLRIADVQTTYTWDGIRKRPTVTHSTVAFTIPRYGVLNSVLIEEKDIV